MIKIIKSNYIAIICLITYSFITITRMLNHTPWFDEAHAWTIAEQLNFIDMFNYVKNEGHFFIWQTLLYPFAHSHIIPYPYPMQALNWIFCFSALIIMWWKAPFNNWIKALITFSFPFLGCYGVLARCYSIGIFLLFLLAVFYNKKMQHPITYSLMLILCANTSVMALIGSCAFGFIFLYDLITDNNLDKKKNILVVSILVFGILIVLIQLLNPSCVTSLHEIRRIHFSISLLKNIFVNDNLFVNVLLLTLFSIPILLHIKKSKDTLFFMFYTYFLLSLFVMVVYGGHFWHSYFFYIYLIIVLWISRAGELKKYALISFSLISLITVIHKPHDIEYYPVLAKDNALKLVSAIENDEILKKSQIIQNDITLYEAIPYSDGKNYKIRNHCNVGSNTDFYLTNLENKICIVKLTMKQAKLRPDIIKGIVDENTYTFVDSNDYIMTKNIYIVKSDKSLFYFRKYKCYYEYCFWKIEVKQ